MVAADHVKLYSYHPVSGGELPEVNPEDTVILYPSDDAVQVDQIHNWSGVRNVLVVDSTWTQTRAVLDRIGSSKFRTVKLNPDYQTTFWRYQDKPASCLATVEAI